MYISFKNLFHQQLSERKCLTCTKNSVMKHYIVLVSIILFFSGCQNSNINKNQKNNDSILSKTIQYKTVDSVDKNLLSLNVYYKKSTSSKKPVIIWVHGGAWIIGDKSNKIQQKVNLFVKEMDYVFVSINYRLSPFPYDIKSPKRIKHPIHVQDVASAIGWVSKNIATYSGNKNRIALLGHSAGAHLVSLIGTNEKYLQSENLKLSDIKGIAAIDTEYDMINRIYNSNLSKMYANAFGKDPTMLKDASPYFNINSKKKYPKFFIVTRGRADRIERANKFIEKLKANGANVTVQKTNSYTHKEVNEAIGKEGETIITPGLTQFFKNCFN